MYNSCCPVCQIPISIHEIERHVNSHFEDDQLARDMELAQQIALAPPSPPHIGKQTRVEFEFDFVYEEAPECSTSRDHQRSSKDETKNIDEQICCIISLQTRAGFYRVEGGIMTLLKNCLEREDSKSMLSGYVDHFQSVISEDMGWGCGWRNIQMACSHSLMARQEAREALFGGSGFVPDIGALQRWLEVAWQRGFDDVGARYFKGKIYGSRKWIGTTECAAILCSFGLRTKIVDFDAKDAKRNGGQFYGPMDRFVVRRESGNGKTGDEFHDYSKHESKGYQALIDWVWRYFSESEPKESRGRSVVVTNKMPLYFQHQGHSRTIVGIQVKRQRDGMKHYNLLVLDPSDSTKALERSLKENVGWQRYLKRGIHTLKKPQYQLCYVDPGIAREEEMAELKRLNSILLEF